MWEDTPWPNAVIGARLGVHAVTVARWARVEAWMRPRGGSTRRKLRASFGLLKQRG